SAPPARRTAATISPTATENPGSCNERLVPNAAADKSRARTRPSTTRRGEANAITVSGDTGQTAARPDRGSRMIDEAKVEAARFGRPGRTTTVGRRTARPSTNPLRL